MVLAFVFISFFVYSIVSIFVHIFYLHDFHETILLFQVRGCPEKTYAVRGRGFFRYRRSSHWNFFTPVEYVVHLSSPDSDPFTV